MTPALSALLVDVRACTVCSQHLPLGPRPVLQADTSARILLVGQAPGRKVHESGVPFDDASGDRLRLWMGVSRDVFYDPERVAIVPMGFCFPGTGASGDLPPRPECAVTWRERVLAQLGRVSLTLVIGQYAQAYHLTTMNDEDRNLSVTEAVQSWRTFLPGVIPLPHPSPRNNLWLKRNPWFEQDLIPVLQARVADVLGSEG